MGCAAESMKLNKLTNMITQERLNFYAIKSENSERKKCKYARQVRKLSKKPINLVFFVVKFQIFSTKLKIFTAFSAKSFYKIQTWKTKAVQEMRNVKNKQSLSLEEHRGREIPYRS